MKQQKNIPANYLKLLLLAIIFLKANSLFAQVGTAWHRQQAEIARIANEEANRNKERLLFEGKWNMKQLPGMVYLKNPMEEMPGMREYGSYHIPFCVDQLSSTSDFGDFRSTANETYTHSYDQNMGTLFEYVHSGYHYMNSNLARVVAAADGIIVAKGDGNFDQNCYYTIGSGNGNYLIIEHSDGKRSGYYHLRNGLTTQKVIGDYINEGEAIGFPGGFLGAYALIPARANLYFELRDAINNVIDPFGHTTPGGVWTWPYAPCSWRDSTYMKSIVGSSQLKYLKTMKHAPNTTDNCGADNFYYTDHFNPGDPFYIRYALTNYDIYNDSVVINIYNPLGVAILPTHIRPRICTNCGSFVHKIDAIQYITYVLPTNPVLMIPGTYTVVLNIPNYAGGYKTFYHYFTVGCQANYFPTANISGESGLIAGNDIVSNQQFYSSSRVKYVAGNQIILSPGFIAFEGSDVFLYNEPCVVPPRLSDEDVTSLEIEKDKILIAPNPARDFITVKILDCNSEAVYKIYNSTLQLVKILNVENGSEQMISLAEFENGIYFIDVQVDNQIYKAKFVVNK